MDIRENTTKVNTSTLQKVSNTILEHNNILKCRDKELQLGKRTLIMGVLNITPDSFYDGGKYTKPESALRRAEQIIERGADIIDIGGESTRPGASEISSEEECQRVIPVISELNKRFDAILSIDTTKSEVAYEALKEGASIVNDISGLKFDEKIADAVSEYKAAIVLTHTSSRPEDMQEHTEYNSLIDDVIQSLGNSIKKAENSGIDRNRIIIDPGFGFGKTPQQNLLILKNLNKFKELGRPVLIGTSNKSFIGKTLNAEIGQRIEGTAATIAIGIMNGASIIRVHDIEYMKKVSKMVDAVINVN